MGTPVYVYPMHEMGGVFADLHGGNVLKGGFRRLPNPLNPDGSAAQQVSYFWDFETPLVEGGRIKLARTGGTFPGLVEAERATAVAMLYAVRLEYKLYPADYSFAKVIQIRPVYNTMRASLDGVKRCYAEMQLSVNKIHSALLNLCRSVSGWFGRAHDDMDGLQWIAVSAFHSALYEKCNSVEFGIRHAASLIEMAEKKDKEPNEQKMFDIIVPFYEVVTWERSYYTLRAVMDNALKKLPGPASPMYTDYMADGQMQASIYVPCEPDVFVGPPANTKAAAKAKLCFAVIEHVRKTLKVQINDLNSPVRVHQEGFIDRFDMKINSIWGCGSKLKEMVDGMGELFQRCEAELLARVPPGGVFGDLYDAIGLYSTKYELIKEEFNGARARLQAMKVDRKEVEKFFVGGDSDDEE